MQLCWGVEAIKGHEIINSDENGKTKPLPVRFGIGAIESGDLVVVTAGVPSGATSTTNMIRVHIAGRVLLSGNGILRKSVTGNVYIAANHKGNYESFKEWRYPCGRHNGASIDGYCKTSRWHYCRRRWLYI